MYNEHLEERIRHILNQKKISYHAKKMMGGLTFMVDDKMCIGIVNDELMTRIGPDVYPQALKKKGCKEMMFTGKPMEGYVFVEPHAIDMEEDLEYWVQLCLDFNPLAKSSKKKKK
ncbi:MAG: TfoX/Sxy family protein [Saprospiraceae bacterium]|nr:TfoX/Sxy family protein [Saprospiraceae bacterium]